MPKATGPLTLNAMRRQGLLVVLAVSLGLNLVLAVGWFGYSQLQQVPYLPHLVLRTTFTNVLRPIRTNLVIRPHVLTWADIESTNYVKYIDNLRSIGCPEATIRDIIVADVSELFARRLAKAVDPPSHQWWTTNADPKVVAAATARVSEIEDQRRTLLNELLGPGWEAAVPSFQFPDRAHPLDGPILGDLPTDTKQSVRAIDLQAQAQIQALNDAATAAGKSVDPAQVAQVKQKMRDALSKVLTPDQLEEYLLRYSDNAASLRQSLSGFSPTPDEFRALFEALDPIDNQLQQLSGATDITSQTERKNLQVQRSNAIRQALGPERYAYYQLTQDPLFQQTRTTAQRLGIAPEDVVPMYQINQMTEQERQRILSDPNLTPEQQTQRLSSVQQARLDTLRKLLGKDAFQRLEGTPSP